MSGIPKEPLPGIWKNGVETYLLLDSDYFAYPPKRWFEFRGEDWGAVSGWTSFTYLPRCLL